MLCLESHLLPLDHMTAMKTYSGGDVIDQSRACSPMLLATLIARMCRRNIVKS